MLKHIAKWFFKSAGLFLLELPVTLLGLVLVAIGIPFRREFPETARPFSDPQFVANAGTWQLVRLPRWLLWWDNQYDGLWGDKRGWWDNYCRDRYKRTCEDFYSMWQWAAVRNPTNYFSRNVVGCDVSRCVIEKLAGQDVVDEDSPGWHFLVATRDDGAQFHYLGFVFPWWFDKTHAVYGRFGWKIKLSHNGTPAEAREQDRFKGNVFRISPWKAID